MTNQQLRAYLDEQAEESKDSVTFEGLDELVSKEVVRDMGNRNAKSQIQGLFADYQSLLERQGPKWIVTDNQKLVLSQIVRLYDPNTFGNVWSLIYLSNNMS